MHLISQNLMCTKSPFYQTDIWKITSEYMDDYKRVIKKREERRIPFYHQSPQILYRKQLIAHLKDFAIKKRLAFCTLHLGVYLMDIFMDNHDINPNKLLLVANVSILLAAKLEESHFNTPLIEQLNEEVGNEYLVSDYERLQFMMLDFFNWSIFFPTAAYYTHYFLQAAISENDLGKTQKTYREMIFDLQECVVTFLNKTIDNVNFMQTYPPSQLAAAIICASRIKVEVSACTSSLCDLTEYTISQLEQPIKFLLDN